jgi:glycosyltransferase involved in cell wall biosynthesis
VPDELSKLMNALAERDPNGRFMVLTGDLETADRHFGSLRDRGLCRISKVPFDQVPAHLAAADAALLLRRRHPVNRVACPVKFAEYWCSGLPVVVTPEIGDISQLVEETGFGVVVDLNHAAGANASRILEANLGSLDRQKIRQRGIDNFGRKAYLSTYSRVFEQLGFSTSEATSLNSTTTARDAHR